MADIVGGIVGGWLEALDSVGVVLSMLDCIGRGCGTSIQEHVRSTGKVDDIQIPRTPQKGPIKGFVVGRLAQSRIQPPNGVGSQKTVSILLFKMYNRTIISHKNKHNLNLILQSPPKG